MEILKADWSLQRKGPADQARHNEKVKEAIKANLGEIVSEEAIITSEGNKIIKIPIRSLEEYKFRYDLRKKKQVGQGAGDSRVGDVIGQVPAGGGKGKKAGSEPGVDYYEVEMTVDDLAQLIFEDLGLPNLKPKQFQEYPSEHVRFTDVRKKGAMTNLDKRRTILANMKRNARRGEAVFDRLEHDDLRFKTWTRDPKRHSAAVVIAMRDVSGSMGEFKKYICRSFYFWMVRFLRTRYANVEIVFITHHTEAREVDEDSFFRLGESGGTKVSSAYQLALNIIEQRYDPGRWNIYPFHFSDGDNWGEADNRLCLQLAQKIVDLSNLFGYGEIREGGYTSTLMSALSAISDPRFVAVTITDKRDVYPALKKFFRKDDGGP